ncbi:methyltransferase domain-containing protein [candidate division KSB1 bacterium]|nr:methyltransferase domain-containing protein [candidate division KSB1 bacterium]RQW01919.1 MAG: class I SAM-dependent methyltransferase [candidate division KSB1 bacterium]
MRKCVTEEEKILKLRDFYERESALVTSPFIDDKLQLNRDLFKQVSRSLSMSFNGKIVLDIGCGSGLLAAFFHDHKFYVGMDLNVRDSFKIMRDESHHYAQANALQLPVADNSIDVAICMDSFEHFPDQPTAAKEIKRVLKPGGFVFLSTPNYANIAGIVKSCCETFGRYEKNTWAPFDYWRAEELEHFMTPRRLRQVFGSAGFSTFARIGFDREVVVGLFPWVWHPKMPGIVASALSKGMSVVAKPICRVWPESSLHTFWRIE